MQVFNSGQGSSAHTLQGGVRSLGDLQDEDGDSDSSGDQGNELFTGGAKRCSLWFSPLSMHNFVGPVALLVAKW